MPGPPPTPTNLKIIRGNPGKRPLNQDEPKYKVEVPRTPAHLSPAAKKHFPKVAKQLAESGVMTAIDTDALSLYCEAFARWKEANQQIIEKGYFETTKNNHIVQNPWVSVMNKASAEMQKIMQQFGMTPASRTKVSANKKPDSGGDGWGNL